MLKAPNTPAQGRGLTAIDGVIALIIILLIVQMWLLAATLAAYLAGHRGAVLPAAAVSGLIFAGCAALYWFVEGIDRRSRH
jgi:predicted Co/Zn/Cd cation transporter (cation efflux family)